MFWVYALANKNTDKIYIGQSENPDERLKWHNQEIKSNKRSYTKINKGPWKIFYREMCETRKHAKIREKQLKSAKGREFIRKEL